MRKLFLLSFILPFITCNERKIEKFQIYFDSSFVYLYQEQKLESSWYDGCYDWESISQKTTILPDSLGGKKMVGTGIVKFFIHNGNVENYMLQYLVLEKNGKKFYFDSVNIIPYIKYFYLYKDSIEIDKIKVSDTPGWRLAVQPLARVFNSWPL